MTNTINFKFNFKTLIVEKKRNAAEDVVKTEGAKLIDISTKWITFNGNGMKKYVSMMTSRSPYY